MVLYMICLYGQFECMGCDFSLNLKKKFVMTKLEIPVGPQKPHSTLRVYIKCHPNDQKYNCKEYDSWHEMTMN